MGQFSFITQDTGESIRNNCEDYDPRMTAYMWDDKGNVWHEKNYQGYGEFGGKDYYALLAEMNENLIPTKITGDTEIDRDHGIYLYFSNIDGIKFPNLTRNKDWQWRNEKPRDCPNQGWGDLADFCSWCMKPITRGQDTDVNFDGDIMHKKCCELSNFNAGM